MLLSGAKSTQRTTMPALSLICSILGLAALRLDKIQMVPSCDPAASFFPSGLKANEDIMSLKSVDISCICCFEFAFHSRMTVLGPGPEATLLLFGLKATALTYRFCANGAPICSPVSTSHNRTVQSDDPEAIFVPSGLKAIEFTTSV